MRAAHASTSGAEVRTDFGQLREMGTGWPKQVWVFFLPFGKISPGVGIEAPGSQDSQPGPRRAIPNFFRFSSDWRRIAGTRREYPISNRERSISIEGARRSLSSSRANGANSLGHHGQWTFVGRPLDIGSFLLMIGLLEGTGTVAFHPNGRRAEWRCLERTFGSKVLMSKGPNGRPSGIPGDAWSQGTFDL